MQFKEFVERMQADDGLKARFIEVAQRKDADALIAFLADEGCETTMEEIGAAMAQGDDEELDLDSLDGVAGAGLDDRSWLENLLIQRAEDVLASHAWCPDGFRWY